MNEFDKNIRKGLEKLSCAALCDASPLVRAFLPGLQPINPELKMVGRIFPISCANDYLSVIKGVSEAKEGDVLVIDGRGQSQAVFGELLAAESVRCDLAGAVVDGAVRDIIGMRDLKFPVYYRVVSPRAGRAEIIEVPAKSVSVRGVMATLGDFIMGDADGIVVMPADHVEEIISVAEEIQHVEAKVFKNVRKGESLIKIIDFEKFRREHEKEIRSNLEYHLKGK